MTPHSAPHTFHLAAGDLRARLARIFPVLAGTRFSVTSTELAGNAWNTRFVRGHRIVAADGSVLACVEKKLAKVAGLAPYEARMQPAAAAVAGDASLLRVPHLGVIDTPFACFLYSELVDGPHAHLGNIAARAGRALADFEMRSAQGQVPSMPGRTLDFFRPWTFARPRYNLSLALRRVLSDGDSSLNQVRAIASDMAPQLRALALSARASTPCISHLDLLSKNLIEGEHGLHLVDWGEARVGRVGFDTGSYLHRLLRGNDMPVYGPWRDAFMQAYLEELPAGTAAVAERNATYFLALRTLCYFARPDVLRQHRQAPQALEAKLSMLLAQVREAIAR